MSDRRRHIAAAFAAAAAYDDVAVAQRLVAARLAARLGSVPAGAAAVEIGCGTGLLTRHLLQQPARWTITDLAPAMVERCAARFAGRAAFSVLDGEAPDLPAASCDLIVSSLAMQWFADLPAALARLARCLRPGGRLLFATVGAGTFAEWRAAHARLGLPCGTPPYPGAEALRRMLPAGGTVAEESVTVWYPDGRAFLGALRRLGAHVPAAGHRPLPPGALRRVLRGFGGGCPATYRVLYGAWEAA